jgi:hypothetical protein
MSVTDHAYFAPLSNPHGTLISAEAPLIDAENLFLHPGPIIGDSIRMRRPCFCATLIHGSMRLAAATLPDAPPRAAFVSSPHGRLDVFRRQEASRSTIITHRKAASALNPTWESSRAHRDRRRRRRR